MIRCLSNSPQRTKQLAAKFSRCLKSGGVLALTGPLGSGKTTFIKGLARGLGLKTKVKSPSFVIAQLHRLPGRKKRTFYHLDLYRLKHQKELLELGFAEILQNPKNLVVIEWPEKAKQFLPAKTIQIKFSYAKNPGERKINISEL